MDDIDIINKLINDILKDKNTFASKSNVDTLNYNLRKTCFDDIINDDYFMYNLIPNYLYQLNKFISQEQLLTFWNVEYDVRYRVKKADTTYLKIKQYSKREKKEGKLQLRKSLNDFLGVRIILPGIINNKDGILLFLETEKQKKLINRYYLRNDGNYHGIHCYFAKNNFTFPWELQIWDTKNKEKNYNEHRLHEKRRREESEGIFK